MDRLVARRWPMSRKDAIGRYGERVAERHLQQQGMLVLDRNWRCDIGEIDLVARDGCTIVVCEVKARTGVGFGSGLEAVTWDKGRRLWRLAQRWVHENAEPTVRVRIDVVAVHRAFRGAAHVEHVRGAL